MKKRLLDVDAFDDDDFLNAEVIPRNDVKFTNYVPRFIIQNLGMDVESLRGKRVLDVGCGEFPRLVLILQSEGIRGAEGIDQMPAPCMKPFLMTGNVEFSIPRPPNYYDVAFSHASIFRDCCWSSLQVGGEKSILKRYRLVRLGVLSCLYNVMNVLKPGGEFIIYKTPAYFLDQERELFEERGIEVRREKVPGRGVEILAPRVVSLGKKAICEMQYRTVLTKER